MPVFLKKNKMKQLIFFLSFITILFFGILSLYQLIFGIIGIIIFGWFLYLIYLQDMKFRNEVQTYVETLSYRVKKVGEEALMEMPFGIMLISDEYFIEWANPFLTSCFHEETLIGKSLYDLCDPLIPMLKQELDTDVITLNDRKYKVYYKKSEKLLYFFDITDQAMIEQLYEEEKTVIAIIFLDNYDELTQGMDDQTRSSLNSLVTSILNNWANQFGIFLKRVSSERFIAVFNEKILSILEERKFAILDEVRETSSKQNVPLTLSIGVGSGSTSLPELGAIAQSSLDLALGRGGDQVAIKLPNGKVKFFGGKTNPVEKRTRVRARVISHALKELIQGKEKVLIMGHKYPDMDALGSAIGVLKMAQLNEREGYIVIDQNHIDKSVKRVIQELKNYPDLYSRLITPEDALQMSLEDTLLVIVDTHRPSLVIEERLVNRIDQIVVIDHHRRGEEFVKNPLLVYMEPYASSTSELVTELLEYQPKGKIDMLEATVLLAGIIVDTKSFTLRTGSRTFDAASYLRSQGADTVLVQKFLREDIDTYIKRSKLIQSVEFYKENIAIAKANDNETYSQVIIAQAADTLLTMENVTASFVISKREDGVIAISARSLGKVNVQIIMELLDGGGHLTNAATQLAGMTISEAEEKLKKAIDEIVEGGKET